MKAAIADCEIVGAMLPPKGKACFDEADLVVRHANGLLRVKAYLQGEVSGEEYSEQNWAAFLADEQATAFACDGALTTGTVLWALRPHFERRAEALAELNASGALVHPVLEGPSAAKLCLIRRELAQPLRQQWKKAAYEYGVRQAHAGAWEAALVCAEQAFVLEPELSEPELALTIVAYGKNEREVRAQGYLEMAESSKGEAFRKRVEAQIHALEAELNPAPAGARRASPGRGPWSKSARQHLAAGLPGPPKKAA